MSDDNNNEGVFTQAPGTTVNVEGESGWKTGWTRSALAKWADPPFAPSTAAKYPEPKPAHDCGLCDAPIVFDGMSDNHTTWRCTSCDWWHISTDCCDRWPPAVVVVVGGVADLLDDEDIVDECDCGLVATWRITYEAQVSDINDAPYGWVPCNDTQCLDHLISSLRTLTDDGGVRNIVVRQIGVVL